MTHRIDLWIATFVAALPRYGEEQAPNVADRACEAFDKRFPTAAPELRTAIPPSASLATPSETKK